MMRIRVGLLLLVFVSSATALSASRLATRNTLNLPATPYRYANVALPAHFTPPGRNDDNTPADNPLTDDGATLGRVLFYDTRLSAKRAGNLERSYRDVVCPLATPASVSAIWTALSAAPLRS